ncbi:MAG: hypothetical protein AB7K09_13235 [Planctomycetota bacterium]
MIRTCCLLAMCVTLLPGCASSPEVSIPGWDQEWHVGVESQVKQMLKGRTDEINAKLPQWKYYGPANRLQTGKFEVKDLKGGTTRCRFYKYVTGSVEARYERLYKPQPGPFQAEQPAGRQYELEYLYTSRVELASSIELVLLLEAEYERDGEVIATRTRRDKVPLGVQMPSMQVEYGRARFRLLKQDTLVRAGHAIEIYDEQHARAIGWSLQRTFSTPGQLVETLRLGLTDLSWPATEQRLSTRIADDDPDKRTFEGWARLIADQFAEE